MKHLLLALSLASSAAFANGVDNMVAQCEEVMRCELCRVSNDPTPPGSSKFVSYADDQGVAHGVRVDAATYDYVRDAGYAKTADGHYVMCQRVREVMQDPTSVRAMGARAMFKQNWIRQKYCP